MKWGRKYGPEFVNALFEGVRLRLAPPYRFICLTDDPTGLNAAVEVGPLPDIPLDPAFPDRGRADETYRKIGVFRRGLAGLQGTILFLDIDVVVCGGLDRLFEYEPGRFCIIRDWLEQRRTPFRRLFDRNFHPHADSNSSVFRFEMPKHGYVYDHLLANQAWVDASFRLEQQYLGAAVGDRAFWPAEWVVSFKRTCVPVFPLNHFVAPREPRGASVIAFHGRPNPDEALAGYRGSWVKSCKPAPWRSRYWHPDEAANRTQSDGAAQGGGAGKAS